MEDGQNFGGQGDFDFDHFFAGAKDGLANLRARKEKLEAVIEDASAELEKLGTQIERLEAIVGSEPERTRKSNVQGVVVDVVNELFTQNTKHVSEDTIVTHVRLKDIEMKEKSIQAVLFRMTKSGKLSRRGKRGSYEYTLLIPGSEVEPTIPHGEGPNVEDKIVETIAQKADGASEKDIAWAAGDLAVAKPILRALIERGAISEEERGGETIYKIVPKAETQRTLFDAESPQS